MKTRHWFLLNQFILIASFSFAQTDFKPGYVVTSEGDSLYGEIDYRGDQLMSTHCRFRSEHDVVTFSPSEISAFRFIGSKYYVSRQVNGKMIFLEYLIKARVNIYYFRDELGDHYYMDREDLPLMEIPYEEGIKSMNNIDVFYESTKHIGLLKYYMNDAPQLQPEIYQLKKPEHRTLVSLAKKYHETVCEYEQCIVYNKNVPNTKLYAELLAGYINYRIENDEIADRNYTQLGALIHIWLPLTSEKLYVRTGFIHAAFEWDDGQRDRLLKFPIQLEYIFTEGLVRPRAAVGYSFYWPNNHSITFNGGVNLKLSETIFISLTADADFIRPPRDVFPTYFISHASSVGIFVRL